MCVLVFIFFSIIITEGRKQRIRIFICRGGGGSAFPAGKKTWKGQKKTFLPQPQPKTPKHKTTEELLKVYHPQLVVHFSVGSSLKIVINKLINTCS